MSEIHVTLLLLLLQARFDRMRRTERGASAIEWVVITALLVALAVGVGTILKTRIEGKANSIDLGP